MYLLNLLNFIAINHNLFKDTGQEPKKLYGEAQNCCETAFKFGFIFDKLNERYLHSVKKTQTDAEYRRILQHVGNMQKERDSLANPNQLRLKVLVDEEWRKKLFLTRKNPIFLGEN